jgi:hypothetical protein
MNTDSSVRRGLAAGVAGGLIVSSMPKQGPLVRQLTKEVSRNSLSL